MTSLVGKLALALAAVGGLSVAVLSPVSVEAGVIHRSAALAATTEDSNVMRVRCDRNLSNLWSCNDDVRVQDRRNMRVQNRPHRCDHSYQTARDGSRCGNRAADKRPGGRT
jgi:hypothetical protein